MVHARHDDTPYKGNTMLYGIALGCALLVFAGAAYVAHDGQAAGWEYTWFRAINNWSASWLEAFSR